MSYANTRLRREIGQYLRQMEEERLSREYVCDSRNILLKLEEHCRQRGVLSAKTMTRDALEEFLDRYGRLSAAYQRRVWAMVRGMLKLSCSPLAFAKRRIRGTGRVKVRWLTPEETEQLFEIPMTSRQRVIVGLELLMGLRRIEVVRLSVQDVNDALRTGTLRVLGKGNKQRPLPMHPDVTSVLKDWLALIDREASESFLGVGTDAVSRDVCAVGVTLGKPLSNHDLRRTCARNWWLAAGETENALLIIAELLGHSNPEVTRLYMGLNVTDMRRMMVRFRLPENCTFLARPALV